MNNFLSIVRGTDVSLRSVVFVSIVYLTFGHSAYSQNCAQTSVGLKPLTELGNGLYKSYNGGLYPNGQNQRPASHDSAGLALAQQVKPLNSLGVSEPLNGKIVLLSIGMSNTTQEFSTFKQLAESDPSKNVRLVIVDGAQGGQTAAIISDPSAAFWTIIDQRLATAGVTREQVQVAWLKEADASPSQPFPTHALTLQSEFEAIVRILKSRYPNIKLTYCSSRTYGGYATSNLNPEPYAYESGFATKWMIGKQLSGDPSLAYSGLNAKAPWLAWGPYLWVDGMTPRTDGFIWECGDVVTSDGTHPSTLGRTKIANLLLTFFKTDATAAPWFLKSPATVVDKTENPTPENFSLEQNYPNPFNPSTFIPFSLPSRQFVTLKIFDMVGKEVATLVNEEKPAGRYAVPFHAHTASLGTLPSGVYLYRLRAGDYAQEQKMILLK